MHENIRQWDPWSGWYWWHRWQNGDAALIPAFVSKFRAWRPLQQRPRDGTIIRHKTGGLQRVG